jgi:hypothetical protein
MDRPFTGDESATRTAHHGPGCDGEAGSSGTGEPERTARATWLLAVVVTACAILASALLPQ